MARRFTTSATAWASARSVLRNLSRAGVAKNRSATSTRVPRFTPAGANGVLQAGVDEDRRSMRRTLLAGGDVSRATEAMEGRASPRKPSVAMAKRSPSGSLEVAWRSTARSRSSALMPAPSSTTLISRRAAAFEHDVDPGRAGIERVLDEFLDGGRRALDHLARSDAVHENRVEPANRGIPPPADCEGRSYSPTGWPTTATSSLPSP